MQNILVVSKLPDEWWVKISDFGISKREEENLHNPSTLKGTIGFLAPELLGFAKAHGGAANDHKTADMWSLGETTVQIVTRKSTFDSPSALWAYCANSGSLSLDSLRSHGLSDEGCSFIQSIMKVAPEERLTAAKALQHAWILTESLSDPKPSTIPFPQNEQ